ncbi:MAG: hypothetical protein Q4F72_10555 [Desulfovibrionaceae bacterium]|nr:hypothetical protein [Desulfovibrionaceae bacterium]
MDNQTAGDSFQRWVSQRPHSENTMQGRASQAMAWLRPYAVHLHPEKSGETPLETLSDAELEAFPEWFAATYRTRPWALATLHNARLALTSVLRGRVSEEALETIRRFRPDTVTRKGQKGSALREKNPTREQLDRVLACLDRRHTFMTDLAAAWLRANSRVGLRPKEWLHAFWTDDPAGGTLCLVNGKQNAFLQHGTGRVRHMLFPGEGNAANRAAVKAFLKLLERGLAPYLAEGLTREQAYRRLLRRCESCLQRANTEAREGRRASKDEKNISLYSGRDAFKADSLALLGDSEDARRTIAALMGHGSIASQKHYAPENISTGRDGMPQALDQEKARVRTRPSRGGGRMRRRQSRDMTPRPR